MVDRLNKTAQNELMNIVTIFLGTTVGATATASTFLSSKTLGIIVVGVLAFGFGTAGGVLLAKLMNKLSGGKDVYKRQTIYIKLGVKIKLFQKLHIKISVYL